MPDLTIEYYWACDQFDLWRRTPPKFRKDDPPCDYDEFIDGKPKIDSQGNRTCPKCGDKVISYRMGV